MFAVSNRKANRLLKTKRKRLKCDVKRVSSSGSSGGGGGSSGFMTTVVHHDNNDDAGVTEDQSPSSRPQLPPPPPPPLSPSIPLSGTDDDDMRLIISTTASVKDNGLYENDTKLLKLIFPTCYQLETFMFLYDFFTLVGEDEKDNHQHNGDGAGNNTSTNAAGAATVSFGTQRSHFQYLLNNSTTKTKTSRLLNDEDIQSMIVNVSLDEDDFKRKLCSFPNLRIVHENISTCPLAMSECTVNYTVLVLEVKIYSLYRQFILNERNKSTSSSSSNTRTNQYCARVIPDEDVFMEMKEMWKSYVFTEKYRPHGRRGSDTLTHSNVDTAVWSQYGDKNNTYLAFLQRNGLMSPSGEPVIPTLPSLSSSIFVNYCSFKIEEIQKGTCVNRLKKRIQLEVGPHTLIKYVSIFAEMYKAFITNVKDANEIISDYESVKHKSLKTTTSDTSASATAASASSLLPPPPPPPPPVPRGRKRKNTEDIIGQYKSLTHKKTKYQSSAAAAAAALCGGDVKSVATAPPTPQLIVAPDLTTLADVAVYSQTTQEVLNDTELQEILNNLFSPCSTDTTTGDTASYQDKPPPVVILNPPPPPTSPMKYAYVKDITRCMEDSSNFEGSNTSTTTTTTNDDDDDTDDDDDDEDVNDDDNI